MSEILNILMCVLIKISLAVSLVGIVILLILVFNTRRITTFLLVTNWFGRYYKISQSAVLSWTVTCQQKKLLKQRPVKAAIKAYGEMFAEDLRSLTGILKPGIHYRVITHYTNLMDDFIKNGDIELLCQPKIVKGHRFLKELRPLLGFKDYRIMKRCRKKSPVKERCCERCAKHKECQCRRGGVCSRAALKTFYQYDFTVTKSDESGE